MLSGCSASRQTARQSGIREANEFERFDAIPDSEKVGDTFSEQTKNSRTGAIDRIMPNDNDKVAFSTTAAYICNKVTGVMVGPSGNLIIRGIGSINSSTDPLVLIDGQEASSVEDIRPVEIYSVDVIKDGSAAIYGMRGANGVIVITSIAAKNAKAAEQAQRKAQREQKRNKSKEEKK